MRALFAIAWKDLRLLLRNRADLFFVVVFPIAFAVFFSMIFGGGGGPESVGVALVDLDESAESADLADRLTQAEMLRVTRAASATEAERAVQAGDAVVFVIIEPGYGESRQQPLRSAPPTVRVGADPSQQAGGRIAEGIVWEIASDQFRTAASDPERLQQQATAWQEEIEADRSVPMMQRRMMGDFFARLRVMMAFARGATSDPESGDPAQPQTGPGAPDFPVSLTMEPVRIERTEIADRPNPSGPRNVFDVTLPQAIIWAMLGCAATFSVSLVGERKARTLLRLRTTPVAPWTILGGKAIACAATILVVATLLITLAALYYGVRPVSPFALIGSVLAATYCFVGVMMLLSVLTKSEGAASAMGWAVLLIMAMAGGAMVPMIFMPAWMQDASHISPVRWAIIALEGAIWRDASFEQLLGWWGVLVAIGTVTFTAGVVRFNWGDRGTA